jgi:hypothetical protein
VESELSDFAEEKPTIENAPEEVPDFDDGIPF